MSNGEPPQVKLCASFGVSHTGGWSNEGKKTNPAPKIVCQTIRQSHSG